MFFFLQFGILIPRQAFPGKKVWSVFAGQCRPMTVCSSGQYQSYSLQIQGNSGSKEHIFFCTSPPENRHFTLQKLDVVIGVYKAKVI